MRSIVFDALRNLSHPGVGASIKLISNHLVWSKMKTEVRTLVENCLQCQRSKVTRHTNSSLENFAVLDKRFEHLNIDLVDPLPVSKSYTYCLTRVDIWIEAILFTDIITETVAKALLSAKLKIWTEVLPIIILGLRTAVKEDLGVSHFG